jgi:23S rRNA (guanine2445-N2)-methyltransferase / 23S rRNA (guanine2069-N7)-methyltransferase
MQREFDVQMDHGWLLATAAQLLAPSGQIVFSNNFQKFKLDDVTLGQFEVEDITRKTIPEDFKRNARIHVCYVLRPKSPVLAGARGPVDTGR